MRKIRKQSRTLSSEKKKSKKNIVEDFIADFAEEIADHSDKLDNVSELFGGEEVRQYDAKKTKTTLEQSTDKPKTNLRQSADKLKTQPETKLRQSTDKPKTQVAVKNNNLRQDTEKPKTQPKTQHKTKLRQSADKPKTNNDFATLVGLQKNCLLLIFDSCQINGSQISDKMMVSDLAKSLQTTNSSIQKTIQRLEKKGFTSRFAFKNGRGGWTQYELPNKVYQQILQKETQDKLRTNLRQTQDKVQTQPKTQPKTRPFNNNRYLNLNTIIKTAQNFSDIKIPDNIRSIGFNENDLEALANINSDSITYEKIKNSLEALSYDVENSSLKPHIKPLSLLLGLLRSGREYRSESLLRANNEQMGAYLKKIEALERSERKNREQLEDIEFLKWKSSLSESEILNLVPEQDFAKSGGPAYEALLKEYFKKQNIR